MSQSLAVSDRHACVRWLTSLPRDTIVPLPVETATVNVLLLGTPWGLHALSTKPRVVQQQTIVVLPAALLSAFNEIAGWLPLRDVLQEEDSLTMPVLRAHASHARFGVAQACTARALCRLLHGTARELSVELLTRIFDGVTLPFAVRALSMHRATLHRRLIDEGSPTARRITALVLVLSCASACATEDVSLAGFASMSTARSMERLRRLLGRHQVSLRDARRLGQHANPQQVVEYLVAIGAPMCIEARKTDLAASDGCLMQPPLDNQAQRCVERGD